MKNKILKKTSTSNGQALVFIILSIICFLVYGLFYYIDANKIMNLEEFVISYNVFLILAMLCLIYVCLFLLFSTKYGNDKRGLNYYELIDFYDKEQYNYFDEKFSLKKSAICNFIETLRLLNINIDNTNINNTNIDFRKCKPNCVCIEFFRDEWHVYNTDEKAKQINCIKFKSHNDIKAFKEFLKRLEISKDTITEIVKCYEHFDNFTYSFVESEKNISLVFRIDKKNIEYFEEKFNFKVNFKDIKQIYNLLHIYDNTIQQ